MNRKFVAEIVNALLELKTKKQLEGFLRGILTPKELDEVSVRLQIIKMLKAGIPQHAIAAKLGVGIATVTRGSKELLQGRFRSVGAKTSWR